MPSPHSSVASVEDLRTGGCWFGPQAQPIFFSRIDNSHLDRIHGSITPAHCFDDGCVGKAANGLERILCGVLFKRTSEKHG